MQRSCQCCDDCLMTHILQIFPAPHALLSAQVREQQILASPVNCPSGIYLGPTDATWQPPACHHPITRAEKAQLSCAMRFILHLAELWQGICGGT